MDQKCDSAAAEPTCRYGASRLDFRGPAREASGTYMVALGGSETFGRFVERPYPDLLSRVTGVPCVNLGCMFAGPGAFHDDGSVLEICDGAVLTVVQLTGAQNLSNRLYSVHPRRNDRFVGLGRDAPRLLPGFDATDVHFTGHLMRRIHDTAPEQVPIVLDELRTAWVARMRSLLMRISGPKLLLWMSMRAPGESADAPDAAEPLFVTADMVAAIADAADGTVDAVASAEARSDDTRAAEAGALPAAASRLPGPAFHREVAERLAETVVPMLGAGGHGLADADWRGGWAAGEAGQSFSVSSGTA